jgi:hypothetical protein
MAVALALPIASLLTETVWAGKDNFTVHNRRNANMTELYISPSSQGSWDNSNVLNEVLRAGENRRISFASSPASECLYDFKAVFENGQQVEDFQIDVCARNDYAFN